MNDHDVIIALCAFDVLIVGMFAACAIAISRLQASLSRKPPMAENLDRAAEFRKPLDIIP